MPHNNHPRRLITHHKPLKKGIKKIKSCYFHFCFIALIRICCYYCQRESSEEKKIIYLCAIICFFSSHQRAWIFFVHSGLMLKIGISKFMHPQCVQVNYINGDLLENYNDNPSNHQVHPMPSIKFITIYIFLPSSFLHHIDALSLDEWNIET